jgi:hypothetical protein
MARIEPLPDHPKLAAAVIQGEQTRKTRQLEMGLVGRIFGDVTEKPGNVAAFAIVFSILMIALLIFFAPKDPGVPTAQLYTLFGGIITLALGFLFGRNSS